MNLAHHVVRAAKVDSAAPALFESLRLVADFGRLAATTAALAGSLRQNFSPVPGSRVALLMKNVPDFVACLYACWHAGLVAVPINARLHPREIAFILENSGAAVAFVTMDLANAASEALGLMDSAKPEVIEIGSAEHRRMERADTIGVANVTASAPAWIFYTSGTTGRPKGAVLSHRNLLAMALNYLAEINPPAPGEALLHAAPMSHGSGLYMIPHVLAMGAQIVPESGRFEPHEILALTAKRNGISFFAAPTMVRRLTLAAEAGSAAPGLKTIIYGGGPMYVADCKAALGVFGPKLTQIYGQGESPMTITFLPKHMHVNNGHVRYEERLASVGFAQGAAEVRAVDADGNNVDTGTIGEIVVRGDTVMSGYWQNPDATRNTLRDGWLYTGDMGSFDADGFLTLKDRSKDVIISGGTNIYPREIEEVLLRHQGVAEVSVIGQPHPDWGEEAVAVIVPGAGHALKREELDQLCGEWIARFKRPKHYFLTSELPKNSYGKVVKIELRTLLNAPSGRLTPLM
jgi:acyl-CoA synthetase (AMP-forming)/AMP-acid ligase II